MVTAVLSTSTESMKRVVKSTVSMVEYTAQPQARDMKLGSRVYAMIRVSSTPASVRAKAVVSAVFLRGNERDDMLF